MKRVLALVNSHGLTSAGDPSGSMEDGAMYRRLRDQGQLTVRIDFSPTTSTPPSRSIKPRRS